MMPRRLLGVSPLCCDRGGPTGYGFTGFRLRPRRPRVLPVVRLSPLYYARGGSSGVRGYGDPNQTSPSLDAARCVTVATLLRPRGGSGVASHAYPDETSPGGCQARNCRHMPTPVGVPAGWRHTLILSEPAPFPARNCRHFWCARGGGLAVWPHTQFQVTP